MYLYGLNTWLMRGIGFQNYCEQPCGADLSSVCRSCALLEWTPWRLCQAHVPCMSAARLTAGQQGLSRIACSARQPPCMNALVTSTYIICPFHNQQHQAADKAANSANDISPQAAEWQRHSFCAAQHPCMPEQPGLCYMCVQATFTSIASSYISSGSTYTHG